MKRVLITCAAAMTLAFSAQGQSNADKAAAFGVVEKLFAEMAAANPAGILATGTAENQLVAIRKLRDGKTRIDVIGGEAFSQMFTNKEVQLREEMYDPQIEVIGDYAMIYGRYVFFVGDKLSHCGVNQFNLVRVDGVWKIANGASTIDPGACTDKEKLMKPDPKRWGIEKSK